MHLGRGSLFHTWSVLSLNTSLLGLFLTDLLVLGHVKSSILFVFRVMFPLMSKRKIKNTVYFISFFFLVFDKSVQCPSDSQSDWLCDVLFQKANMATAIMISLRVQTPDCTNHWVTSWWIPLFFFMDRHSKVTTNWEYILDNAVSTGSHWCDMLWLN